MLTINMLSKADSVKGHGVLSAHDEQVELVRQELADWFLVEENSWRRCDIVHLHTINPSLLLKHWCIKGRGRSVASVHFLPETVDNSISLPDWMQRAFYWYILFFYRRMDRLVTVNPYFIDVLERYGIRREKVAYIPNFVSDQRFYRLEEPERLRLRRQYGLESGRFTVLCVGQLQKRKGVLEFIKVAREMPQLQFLWAGDFTFGKISDGYEQIRRAVESPPDNLRFLGLVERERMNEVYNLSDVMFLPSYEELFPMTILEAMSCGIPVLVRELEIYHKILFDFCLTGGSRADFVCTLERLRSDEAFYRQAEQNSRRGHEFYSRERVSGEWKRFYEGVARGGDPGAARQQTMEE